MSIHPQNCLGGGKLNWKVQAKLSLRSPWRRMGKWRCSCKTTVHGNVWLTPRRGRFVSMKRAHCTHWIAGWVGPRTDLEVLNTQNFLSLSEIEPRVFGCPARSLATVTSMSCRFQCWTVSHTNNVPCCCVVWRAVLHNSLTNDLFGQHSEPKEAIEKGPAIPVQVWAGLEGSTWLRLPDFKTTGTWRW